MSRICILFLFLIPLHAAVVSVKSHCDAITVSNKYNNIKIRGLARFFRNELIMIDYTCPVAKSAKDRLPSLILVENASVAQLERMLRDEVKLSASAYGPFIQLVVQGKLICKKFKIEVDNSGSAIAGSGFGALGLASCRLIDAEVIDAAAID